MPPPAQPGLVGPATEIRGALLASSVAIVRERGREAEYFARLPEPHRDAMRTVIAQAWLPMELAVRHYETMDALFPTALEQIENGKLASERTQNTWVRTIARGLSATGSVDVPAALKRLPSAFERLLRGGGVMAVYRTGPKDACVELSRFPFLRVAYARNAWQGMFESGLTLVAPRLFVRQDAKFAHDDRMALTLSWV